MNTRVVIVILLLAGSLYSPAADTAYDVTSGSLFTITAGQTAGSNRFQSKPRVYVVANGRRWRCRVVERKKSFPRETLTCLWHKKASPGTYSLFIRRKGSAHLPEEISDTFIVHAPAVTAVTPASGGGGETILLEGWYFGDKPKVWLQTSAGKKLKCRYEKPLPYNDWRDRPGKSCMQAASGLSSVQITLNRKCKQYDNSMLYVRNRSGIGMIAFNETNRVNLTMAACPLNSGTLVPAAGPQHTILRDATLQLTACPNPGYRFVQWKTASDIPHIENRYAAETRMTLSDDAVVTALFTNSPVKAWTLMAYMNGDNNLETDYIHAFEHMISNAVGSSRAVNFIVQFDRIPDYSTNYGDWTICHRFHVTPGMQPVESAAITDWDDGLGGGREVSMAEPETLSDFINWAAGHYPATNYALMIGDHGFSWQGCCLDETSDQDYMFLREVARAVEQARYRMEMIVFDACLMGTVDVAYELRSSGASVMVASEQPGSVWPYWDVVKAFMDHPGWSARQFGTALTDYYFEYNKTDPTIRGATMASIDLNQIVPLCSSFRELILLATNEAPYEILQQKAREVTNHSNQAVIHHRENEYWLTNAYGLSLYFPLYTDQPDVFREYYVGKRVSFARDTVWRDFLNLLHDPMSSPVVLDSNFFQVRNSMSNIMLVASYNVDLREYLRRFIVRGSMTTMVLRTAE